MSGPHSFRRFLAPALILFSLCPSTAYAHSAMPGANEFYNGALHPLLTPQHALLVAAIAILLGQSSKETFVTGSIVFTAVSAAALLVSFFAQQTLPMPAFLLLSGVTGLLIACEHKLSRFTTVILFGVSAIVLGFDSAPEGETIWKVLKFGIGTWVGLVAVTVDLAFYLSLLKRPWLRIGIRVLGSWVTAIAVMMMALSISSAGKAGTTASSPSQSEP